jgi:hypothetical protein
MESSVVVQLESTSRGSNRNSMEMAPRQTSLDRLGRLSLFSGVVGQPGNRDKIGLLEKTKHLAENNERLFTEIGVFWSYFPKFKINLAIFPQIFFM